MAGAAAAVTTAAAAAVPGTAHGVAGGTPAAEGSYSFMAMVDAGERACSGVLVHAEWIVTVKSCLGNVPPLAGPPPGAVTVTVGRTDLSQGTGGVRVRVAEVSPHPTLNVVLAKLASPVTGIAPVAVGSAPVVGETVRVAGYGRTAEVWVPDRLHTAAVSVDTVTDGGFTVAAAGTAAVTTCQGDAGGATVREANGQVELVGLHDGSRQGGCAAGTGTDRAASEIRADRLGDWIRQHVTVPRPVDEMSRNLARDARFTASSSAENWGWNLVDINDGDHDQNGWTSWPPSDTGRTEWLEFAFPDGSARRVNRVDLYPRIDVPVAENNFPTNVVIKAWTGTAWETVASKTNIPRSTSGQRFGFPARSTTKLRVEGTNVKMMQLTEVGAYLSTNLAADATVTASSSAENWGWNLREINDGVRDGSGWTSWPPSETGRTEWLEFAFPGEAARRVNRVDLYPRIDVPVAENNFPTNVVIKAWTGTAWETVASKTNIPRSTSGQRFGFPARSTTKLRVEGTNVKMMQLNEVEAYLSTNLAADATVTASSSAENWGWNLREINDGVRDGSGWTSWPPSETGRTEWLEFAFPGEAARQVNRVDLYPRIDVPVAENNFPSDFTVKVWTGTAWETVVSRIGYPKPAAVPARLAFPARTTVKLRVEGTNLKMMQLNEVEVYNHHPSAAVAAPAEPLPSIVEQRDYPGAAAILAERGITLKKGDGHLLLVDCGPDSNNPPPNIILVQTYELDRPGGADACFKATGASGWLTMEISKVYTIRGENSRTVAAKVEVKEDPAVVEVERVDPGEWQPVGVGASRADAVLLELRFPYTS